MDDELFEDGEKFSIKAKQAGVDVTFRAGEGMVHCYPLLAPMFKEAFLFQILKPNSLDIELLGLFLECNSCLNFRKT